MQDYWWITRPKRRLDCVCRELIAFHNVAVGKSWNANRSIQFEFEKMLETLNIKRHDSEKQSSGSSARTHATMLYSLGLWYEQDQCVYLTPAGAALVDGEPPVPILTHQVIHYQFPSAYSKIRNIEVSSRFHHIKPFRFLLRLLRDERVCILSNEEIAFVVMIQAENETQDCYEKVVESVLSFRKSKSDWSIFGEDYFAKHGASRTNLLDVANTITLWLEYTSLIKRDGSRITCVKERIEEIDDIVADKGGFVPDDLPAHEFQLRYGALMYREDEKMKNTDDSYIELLPDAPSLIESTRSIGYTLEVAIADIIDNSITAGATCVDIDYMPTPEPYIAIIDNGCGMAGAAFTQAMQFGSRNPNDSRSQGDLGRFGLGLKTASLSQCRCLTVISKCDGRIEGRQWNIDDVVARKTWALKCLNEAKCRSDYHFCEKLSGSPSGTIVLWQKFDRLMAGESNIESAMSKKMNVVHKHLSEVFHRYLSGDDGCPHIQIRMNHSALKPIDPFLKSRCTQIMADEIVTVGDSRVVIRPYLLPPFAKLTREELQSLGDEKELFKNQGIYVYRNNRLLIKSTWFKMMRKSELTKLARIQIDIPNALDDMWSIDIKKSSARIPECILSVIRKLIERMGEHSKRAYTFRGKKEVDDKEVQIWNRLKMRDNAVRYAINRQHPIVEKIIELAPEARRTLELLLTQIENTIPLRQIFIDMTGDGDAIIDDDAAQTCDIVEKLSQAIGEFKTAQEKRSFIDVIRNIQPYKKFFDENKLLLAEVENYISVK